MNRRRSLLVLGGIFALLAIVQTVMSSILGDLTSTLLDLETTLSDDTFAGILNGLGDGEITRLQRSIRLDFLYALLYGSLLWWGVRIVNDLSSLTPRTYRLLSAIPIAAVSLDYLENLSHLYLIDHRDAISPIVIAVTGSVSWLKWALALGILGFLIWRLPRALIRTRGAVA